MATSEAALIIAGLFLLTIVVFLPKFRLLAFTGAAAVLPALAFHLLCGTVRLGMMGAYLATAGLIFWVASSIAPNRPPFFGRSTGTAAALLTFVLLLWPAAAATILSPLLTPAPEGPFLVGSSIPSLGPIEPDEATYRTPAIELWYPVDPKTVNASSWWPGSLNAGLMRRFKRSGIAGAPVSKAAVKYPVLLYFSGAAGTEVDGGNLVREIVSHGFVVATVHYPVEYPELSPKALAKRRADLEQQLFYFPSEAAFNQALEKINLRVRERAQDASSILDALTKLSAGSDGDGLAGRLDIDRAGILGFSFGGSIAAEAHSLDPRFKAALNIDGWHFGNAANSVAFPYMLIMSEETRLLNETKLSPSSPSQLRYSWLLTSCDFAKPIAGMRNRGGYLVNIAGTRHINFSDGAFSGSLFRRTPGVGPISPNRAFHIMASYAIALFEIYLKDRPPSLLNSISGAYPEASLQVWPVQRR